MTKRPTRSASSRLLWARTLRERVPLLSPPRSSTDSSSMRSDRAQSGKGALVLAVPGRGRPSTRTLQRGKRSYERRDSAVHGPIQRGLTLSRCGTRPSRPLPAQQRCWGPLPHIRRNAMRVWAREVSCLQRAMASPLLTMAIAHTVRRRGGAHRRKLAGDLKESTFQPSGLRHASQRNVSTRHHRCKA